MWRMIVMVFVVGLLAPGCSYLGFERDGDRDEGNADEPVADHVKAPPAAAIDPVLRPRPKPSPSPVPAPASAPSFDPATLIGLDQAEVLAAFGEPTARKDDAPARVWQYATGECAVNLFFYLDLGDEQFHLLTYKVNKTDGGKVNQTNGGTDAAQRCFDQVLGRRPQAN